MKFVRKVCLLSLFIPAFNSCSKNVEQTSSQEVEEKDTIAYPATMKVVRVWPKGTSRIYSNQQEIKDSIYAMTFIYESTDDFLHNFEPPKTLNYWSKDSLTLTYGSQPVNYGIEKDEDVYKLHSQFPFPSDWIKDSVMRELAPDRRPGMFHEVLTSFGDNKEYKIKVFAYLLRQYKKDSDGIVRHKYMRRGSCMSEFRESYVKALTTLDTFAIQEYEIIYK